MHQRQPYRALVALLLLLPLAPLASPAPAPEPLVPLPGQVAPFVLVAEDLGPAPPDRPVHLVLALAPRDRAGLLEAASAGVALPRADVVARFSPEPAQLERVAAWLRSGGLDARPAGANSSLVEAHTNVGDVSRLLRVPLRLYRVGDDVVLANPAPPLVPASLAPALDAIVGLVDMPLRTHLVTDEPDSGANGAPPYGPADLRGAYDVNPILARGYDGAGTRIGITGWGAPSQTSLDFYSTEYGLPPATVTARNVNGGSGCSGSDQHAQIEWDMDIQLEHGLAPNAELYAYCSTSASLSDMLLLLGRLVDDNLLDVVSQSWGLCEAYLSGGTMNAYDARFAEASAQGTSFFTASGDGGSRECTRQDPSRQQISSSFPAIAPHTVSVGGTTLRMSSTTTVTSETTWRRCTPCSDGVWVATGGGVSSHFPKPSWQWTPVAATGRGSPDISAVADPATGVRVRSGGSWWTVGGTSASSPLVAGIFALHVDAQGRQGNLGPRLWEVAVSPSAILRDITEGHNGDYTAGPGFDYPTGLGAPRSNALLATLANALPPTGVTAAGGEGSVLVSWTSPGPSAFAYRVYRAPAGGASTLIAEPGNVTTFLDEGLPSDTAYEYQVSAITSSGEGILSDKAPARTNGPPRAPPAGVSASLADAGASLRIAWGATTDDGGSPAVEYRVYRSTNEAYPSQDALDATRLLGGETFALPLDADDHEVPASRRSRDASGRDNHALKSIGLATTAGRFGRAYAFDGAGDWMDVIEANATTSGTVMAWVKLESASQATIIARESSQAPLAQLFNVASTTRKLQLQNGGGAPVLVGATPIALNEWTHVAASWSPQGKRLFVNGVLDASDADATPVKPGYYLTLFGNRLASVGSGGMRGALDELREYPRVLSESEIRTIAFSPYAHGAVEGWQLLATSPAPGEFLDNDVAPGAGRSYVVAAVNAHGEGARSVAVGLALPGNPAGAPALAAQTGAAPGEIALAWAAPAGAAPDAYRVFAGVSAAALAPLADVPTLSHVDAGLADGARRVYAVAALTGGVEGPRSVPRAAQAQGAPDAPWGVAVTTGPGSGDISLAWNAPAREGGSPVTGYRVQRDGVVVAETASAAFTDSGLGVDRLASYRVSAVNARGESPTTTALSGRTFAVPPMAPLALAATGGPGVGEVTLAWARPPRTGGSVGISYRVHADGVLIAETPALGHLHAGLAEGQAVQYAVSVVNPAGEGPLTLPALGRAFARPAAPFSLLASAGPGRGEITLTWSAPDDGGAPIEKFLVLAGNAPGEETLVGEATVSAYTESFLADAQTRHYRVVAQNLVGEGPASDPVAGTAAALPPAPAFLTLSRVGTETRLTWASPPGNLSLYALTAFRVYRQVDPDPELLLVNLSPAARAMDDATCAAGATCRYRVAAAGIAGDGPATAAASQTGSSLGVRVPGARSADPTRPARLAGHEILALQLDADDALAGGRTRDSSPRQAHAEVVNAYPTSPGRHGMAYRTTTAGSYLSVPDSTTTSLGEGTVMLWVKPTSITPGHTHLVVKGSPLFVDLELMLDPATGKPSFSLWNDPAIVGTTVLPLNEWTHVAATWGGDSGGLALYVNGRLEAQGGAARIVGLTTTHTLVGANPMLARSTGFLGAYDDVRFYDLALREGEIQDLALHPYVRVP